MKRRKSCGLEINQQISILPFSKVKSPPLISSEQLSSSATKGFVGLPKTVFRNLLLFLDEDSCLSLATLFLDDIRYRPFLQILALRAPEIVLRLQATKLKCSTDQNNVGVSGLETGGSDTVVKDSGDNPMAVSFLQNTQLKEPTLCLSKCALLHSSCGRLSSLVINHPTLIGETINAQKVTITGKEIRDCTINALTVEINCFKLVDTDMPECRNLLVKTNFIDGALPKAISYLDLELRSWDSLHEDMFSHLIHVKQLILTYDWELTCSLFLPPEMESVELVDMEILRSRSPIFISVQLLRQLIFRNCSFEDLSYDRLGHPPRLQAIDFISCRSCFNSFESFRRENCILKVNGEDMTSGGDLSDHDFLLCF